MEFRDLRRALSFRMPFELSSWQDGEGILLQSCEQGVLLAAAEAEATRCALGTAQAERDESCHGVNPWGKGSGGGEVPKCVDLATGGG